MGNPNPKLSIGLPVYNGERFVSECIESILGQSFADFELVISDNASTDSTEGICRAFAAKDPRVRYYRSDVNRGAAWNYNRVFQESRGEYFKWAAHDDVCHREYFASCLRILDTEPGVVLCYPRIVDIDEGGREVKRKQSTLVSGDKGRHQRFSDIVDMRHTCEEVFGVVRADALRATDLIGNYTDSDRVLLADLGLMGTFREVPEYLFFHRIHRKSSVEEYPGRHVRSVWFDPTAAGKLVYPYWRELSEYTKVVLRNRLTLRERCGCFVTLSRWMLATRTQLYGDLVYALRWSVLKYAGWTRVVWHWLRRSSSAQ